jgi:hypothetical protein
MLKEFPEHKKAVYVDDSTGDVIRQLSYADDVLKYSTKKEAMFFAGKMGIPQNHVEKCKGSFFNYYAIRWDFRFPYYVACWEV